MGMPRKGEFKLTEEQQTESRKGWKLTDAQKDEIARRYAGGESSPGLATEFGVSARWVTKIVRRAGVPIREQGPSPETLQAMVRRYAAGEPAHTLAREYGSHVSVVQRVAAEAGIPVRGKREATINHYGLDVHTISAQRWSEIYWADDKPSVRELARRLNANETTIRDCLVRAGVGLRTASEQQSIDLARGRRPPSPAPPQPAPERRFDIGSLYRGKRLPASTRRAVSEARTVWVGACCSWCGALLRRKPHQLKQYPLSACGRSCSSSLMRFRQRHGPDAPRPLIVDRLVTLARTKGRPYTYLRVERLMGECGAKVAEVEAALDRLQEL